MGNPHSPTGDHYVTGDTNWNTYDLQQLVAMVTEKVDLPGLVGLADDWRRTGNDLVESAQDLAGVLDHLMDFWSGTASEQARTDVALNAQWLSDLGATAYTIGTPVEDAAGALKAAQEQMPQPPDVDPAVAPGSAPDGAAAGELSGGPLGAAIGGVAAGSESAAEAQQQQADLKRQAVETMRRFETAAMGIDDAIPQFEGPSAALHPNPQPGGPGRPQPGSPAGPVTPAPPDTSWAGLTGGSGTAAAGDGDSHRGTGRGVPVGAGIGGGAGAGGIGLQATPGLAGLSGGRVGGSGPGAGSGTGAMPAPDRVAPLPAAAAGALAEAEGHPAGGGMTGAPMAGMGAGAGAGGAGDHRRRFPFDGDEPFALDKKASPPVIGI